MIINGSDLRAMRQSAEKTTVKMAEFAGVKTRKTYENWEKNIGQPNINQFLAMVKRCNYSPEKVISQALSRKGESTLDWEQAKLIGSN